MIGENNKRLVRLSTVNKMHNRPVQINKSSVK
jgi:hypothetical protein